MKTYVILHNVLTYNLGRFLSLLLLEKEKKNQV